MAKFIFNISKFFSICIFLGFLIIIFSFFISSTKNIFDVNFIEKDKNIFILGDSNTECAINDSIFKNSKNLSSSGEPYFDTYSKIQKLLLEEVKIDYIFLSYTPHNLYENPFANTRRNYKYISFSTFKRLFFYKENKLEFLNGVVKDKLKVHFKIGGGFLKLERDNLKNHKFSLLENKELEYFPNQILSVDSNHRVTQIQKYFLDKIINICSEEQIHLILINTPKINELLDDSRYCVSQFNDFHKNNYNKIHYIDHSKLELNEKYFGDFIHLNSDGANFYSSYLNQYFYSTIHKKNNSLENN